MSPGKGEDLGGLQVVLKTDENGSREAIGRGEARWEEVVFLREQFFDFCTTRLLNSGFHILLSGSVFLLLFGFCFWVFFQFS